MAERLLVCRESGRAPDDFPYRFTAKALFAEVLSNLAHWPVRDLRLALRS